MKFIPPMQFHKAPKVDGLPEGMDFEKFKKTAAYKKHVAPVKQRDKDAKRERRKKTIRDNWISVATLIVAVITLIATIWFGLH